MPLVVAFWLIGFFVWLGENIATYFKAWYYQHQLNGWDLVSRSKVLSWTIMVVVAVVAVVIVWLWRERDTVGAFDSSPRSMS